MVVHERIGEISSRRLLFSIAALGAATALWLPTGAGQRGASAASEAYIVVLRGTVDDPAAVADDHARRHGVEVRHIYRHALEGYAARIPSDQIEAIQRDDRVAFLTSDRVVTVSSREQQPAQSRPTGIERIGVADLEGELARAAAAAEVDVAVLDTGIDDSHPDLNVAGGVDCSGGVTQRDHNGHGTHVAGTIGAHDNEIGVVGVVPGARLWAVKVLDDAGFGTWSSVLCGIDFVTANASTIRVANMSFGGPGSDDGACGAINHDALHKAICASVAAGVTYVAAAGNGGVDASGTVPASYDEVITVSALTDFDGLSGGGARPSCVEDQDDSFANFSNYGPDVDLIAPGVCIESTWTGGGYRTLSGTSMAAPHVAGAAALLVSFAPETAPARIKETLLRAGTLLWSNADDPDGIKEPLLNVANL